MASYLRDIPSNSVKLEGVTISTTSTTVTGATQDFITGDGRCTAMIQVSALSSAATLTVFASESTDGTTFTAVSPTGSTAITTTGIFAFSFDRTKRYLQFYNSITSNKTATFGVVGLEQLKTY